MLIPYHAASELIAHRTGILYTKDRYEHLGFCLRATLRDLKIDQMDEYLQMLTAQSLTESAWQRLIYHLTIGETYFFRNALILKERVLPEMIATRRNTNNLRLRVWSAGCATGEEPYTITMLLHDLIPDIDKWSIAILGTDLNMQALETAKIGRYSDWSMRNVPDQIHYLRKVGDAWEVDSRLKQFVEFRFCNLIDPNEFFGQFDLILCRNVLLYMGLEHRQRVKARLEAALAAEDGRLIISDSDPYLHEHRKATYQPTMHAHRPIGDEPLLLAQRAADSQAWAEAHRWLDHAEAYNKLDLSAHYLRAMVFDGEGRTNNAIQAMRRCLYIDPNFALAHFMLGNYYAKEQDRHQAMHFWQNAIRALDGLPTQAFVFMGDGLTVGDLMAMIYNQVDNLPTTNTTPSPSIST